MRRLRQLRWWDLTESMAALLRLLLKLNELVRVGGEDNLLLVMICELRASFLVPTSNMLVKVLES